MSIGSRLKSGLLLYRPVPSTTWGGDSKPFVRSFRGDFRAAPISSSFRNNKMLETVTHTLYVGPREDIVLEDRVEYRGEEYRVVYVARPTEDNPRWKTVFLELVK